MSMVYGSQDANIYGFQALAEWANAKYNAGLTAERIQDTKPRDLHGATAGAERKLQRWQAR